MSTSSQSPATADNGPVRELLESLCENEDIRVEFLTQLLGRAACRQLAVYRLPDDFVLSVVVPVYNEVETLPKLIAAIRDNGVRCEIILVDDGSQDGTREMLDTWRDQSDLKIIFHEKNQGKGAALRTGFVEATGDAVIIQDADLEYSPDDYRALLQPIVMEGADVVYGSRFIPGARNVPRLRHYIPNKVLTWWSNLFTNFLLTDMETCYKVFRREIIQKIGPTLQEKRFGVEPEMTAKLSRIPGLKLREVPIRYFPRTYAEGKKIGWRDGLRALWCVIRY